MGEENHKKSGIIDVAYVARLARLELTPPEIDEFQKQLEHVIRYIDTLDRADVSAVEPTAHSVPVQNVFRKDIARDSLDHDAVLANAPVQTNGQFTVPKIVE